MSREERNQIRMEASIEHLHQFSSKVLDLILKTAVQYTIREAQRGKPSKHKFDKGAVYHPAQGNLPVDTGTLRASLISELDGGQLNLGIKSTDENAVGYDATTAIAGVKIGARVSFGWTVNYAEIVEFGDGNKRKGNFFMTSSVKQWQRWVNYGVAEAKIRRNVLGRGIGGVNPRPALFLTGD